MHYNLSMNYNILDFGASVDNLDNAIYIQKAIDEASLYNGRVIIPTGLFLSSTIFLKSNVELHLEKGAVLKAVDDISAFNINKKKVDDNLATPSYVNCDYDGKPELYFICGFSLSNVAITGDGIIDGNESIFYGYQDKYFIDGAFYPRMPLLYLEDVDRFKSNNITLIHSAFWTCHLVGCRNGIINNLKIYNNLKLANCDGIDPDHCHDICISNCHIECADDAIVFKNTKANMKYGDCYNITVNNCYLKTTSGAIKFGTESYNDFYSIKVNNIEVVDSNRGITLQLRDIGNIYNCLFENINMTTRVFAKPYFWGYGEPICITALDRSHEIKAGTIHDLIFKNITADCENGILIYGENITSINNIKFKDIKLTMHNKSKWPKDKKDLRPYDKMPFVSSLSNALYIRKAANVTFNNFRYEIDPSLNVDKEIDIKNIENIVVD